MNVNTTLFVYKKTPQGTAPLKAVQAAHIESLSANNQPAARSVAEGVMMLPVEKR